VLRIPPVSTIGSCVPCECPDEEQHPSLIGNVR
jgi:hypothetical protein